MKIVTYEDRPSDAIGIELLVLSLARHCSDLAVEVTFPNAPTKLVQWASGRERLTLQTKWSGGPERNGWNIKPHLLLSALDRGETEPIWMDSDIVLTADFRALLAGIDERTIVVAEDYFGAPLQGGASRTSDWGLAVGRNFPNTVNTCIVRMTNAHRALLEHWDALMQTDAYRTVQAAHWSKRPLHMMGDQDVLAALLGAAQYADFPVRWIRRGREVAHCNQYGGYRAHEQLGNLLQRRRPVFLHGQGEKIWRPNSGRTVHLELSPYTLEAMEYAAGLDEWPTWAAPTLRVSRLIRMISPRRRAALLPAIVHELRDQRILKTAVKRALGRS